MMNQFTKIHASLLRTGLGLLCLRATVVLMLAVPGDLGAQATEIQIQLVPSSGLSSPVNITDAGDGRLFITERAGRIKIMTIDGQGQGTVLATPFLDIDSLVQSGGEQGLLGTEFHPDYAANGFFFVNYTCSGGSPDCGSAGDTVIARYSRSAVNPNLADSTTRLGVATIPQDASNHNAGQIQFEPFPDPNDGRTILYIGTGDGGGGNDPNEHAQNLGSLLGKMLRVDVDNLNAAAPLPRYHIPNDNPNIGGSVTELWAIGLRNPWRFSFDRVTGDMLIGDVGQNNIEEITFQPANSTGGENYGWRQCEGVLGNLGEATDQQCADGELGTTPPILWYEHVSGCKSITGGYVYRGSDFNTELGGTYFYADYCSGMLWGARDDGQGNWSNEITFDTGFNSGISTFGQDQNGELYFATIQGDIYRIEPLPTELPDLTVLTVDGPTDGTIGQNINVTTTTVHNVGDGDSGPFRVGFYLTQDLGEPDQTFTGSTCNVSSLNAGVMDTCSNTTVSVPNSLAPGDYYLAGIVDDNGVVTESDETNNDATDSNMIALACGSSMENCLDGIDNNCDGLVDGDDPLCANACTATGLSCSSDDDCCSSKCKGGRNPTCKGEVACTPTETPEQTCDDQIDNDCNGLTDTADPNCACTPTPGQENAETSCDDTFDNDCDGDIDSADSDCGPMCAPKADSCTLNSDCCSNKCRGPSGGKTCK